MKRIATAGVVVAGTLILAGFTASGVHPTKGHAPNKTPIGKPIVIGAVTVLSGPSAAIGEYEVRAAQLAVAQLNRGGGLLVKGVRRPLRLVQEDDQGRPPSAVNAVNKLIQQNRAVAILGPDFSNNVLATLPITKQRKVLQFYATTSLATRNADVRSPYGFRCRSEDTYWARAVANFVDNRFGTRARVGFAAINLEYGLTATDVLAGSLASRGISPVARTNHNFGDVDLTASAAAFVRANANVVVAWTLQQQGVLLRRALRQLGWNGTFIYSTPDPIFVGLGGADVEGVVGPQNWVASDTTKRSKQFVRAYRQRFRGSLPDSHSACFYDAVYLLADAIKRVGTNPDRIRRHIARLKRWTGVQGTFRPAALRFGNTITAVQLVQVRNGRTVILRKYR